LKLSVLVNKRLSCDRYVGKYLQMLSVRKGWERENLNNAKKVFVRPGSAIRGRFLSQKPSCLQRFGNESSRTLRAETEARWRTMQYLFIFIHHIGRINKLTNKTNACI